MTLDEVKIKTMRAGLAVVEDQLESPLCTSGDGAAVCDGQRLATRRSWARDDGHCSAGIG